MTAADVALGANFGDPLATLRWAREELARLGVASGSASEIAVEGDSMRPTLHSGDRILVDRASRHSGAGTDRAIGVIRIDDDLLVKRLRRDGDGWRVVSDNAPERVVAADDVEIVGRVVQLIRRL